MSQSGPRLRAPAPDNPALHRSRAAKLSSSSDAKSGGSEHAHRPLAARPAARLRSRPRRQSHGSRRVTPELGLSSRQCQQQLLETAATVICVRNRSLCFGFSVATLEHGVSRAPRLWPELGPRLLLRGHLPTKAFFSHSSGKGRLWPQARPSFHSSRSLSQNPPKGAMTLTSTCGS